MVQIYYPLFQNLYICVAYKSWKSYLKSLTGFENMALERAKNVTSATKFALFTIFKIAVKIVAGHIPLSYKRF